MWPLSSHSVVQLSASEPKREFPNPVWPQPTTSPRPSECPGHLSAGGRPCCPLAAVGQPSRGRKASTWDQAAAETQTPSWTQTSLGPEPLSCSPRGPLQAGRCDSCAGHSRNRISAVWAHTGPSHLISTTTPHSPGL